MGQGTRSDLAGKPRSRRYQPRIPTELHERLAREAERRDVSMNYLTTRAIEKFLDEIEGKPLA